jgi:hypothetical protein
VTEELIVEEPMEEDRPAFDPTQVGPLVLTDQEKLLKAAAIHIKAESVTVTESQCNGRDHPI